MDSIQRIRETNQRNAQLKVESERASEQSQSNATNQRVIFEAFQAMVDAIKGDKTKSETIVHILGILDIDQKEIEKNKHELESLSTGLENLEKELKALGDDGLKAIPKLLAQKESVKVSNFDELQEMFKSLTEAVKSGKAPVVNVPEAVVKVAAPIVNVPAPIVNVPKSTINLPEPKVTTTVIVRDWKRDYAFSDAEKDEGTGYYGYVRPDGHWYIMRHMQNDAEEEYTLENSRETARFVFGKKNYRESWNDHETLKFKYLHEAYLE